MSCNVEQQNCRSVEENVHLDGDSKAEHDTANTDSVIHPQVDGKIEEENSYWIIEQSENKDGVNPVACQRHQHHQVGWQLLCSDNDPEDQPQVEEVEAGKDVLGEDDVGPLVGDVVEAHVEPDEASRIDQGSSVAP